MKFLSLIITLVAVAAPGVVMGEGDSAGLRRNPFAVPASQQPPAKPAAPARDAEPVVVPEPRFRLRAVLAAGSNSLANIDGRIVAAGEAIDGYRVIAIREQSVVLQRAGRRMVLGVFDADDTRGRE